ncbi:hypothetical protein MOOR_27720 [Moorella thermoacetica]|uniref:Uncharacterized protein n=1 Tax=Neomoorella thermoacetica TaxID=1525 RepID=A0A1J5JLL8_NEOTH|nr:hypothetical protein MOOR_27720 [Moorella thermoacetica]
MLVLHRYLQVLQNPDRPRSAGAGPVAGNGHKIKLQGDGNLPHQVGQENNRPFENTDHQQVLPGVIAANSRTHFLHPFLNIGGADQDLGNIFVHSFFLPRSNLLYLIYRLTVYHNLVIFAI